MEKELCDLEPGQSGVLTELVGDSAVLARLKVFGMVPGTAVICRYQGPGKHLYGIECRGAVIALRKYDLKKIRVRV